MEGKIDPYNHEKHGLEINTRMLIYVDLRGDTDFERNAS